MPKCPPSYSPPRPARLLPPPPRRDTRPDRNARGYDNDWYRLRNWFIHQHPICVTPGCGRPARMVDHIKPVRKYPELRLCADNLQSMCLYCHARKVEE